METLWWGSCSRSVANYLLTYIMKCPHEYIRKAKNETSQPFYNWNGIMKILSLGRNFRHWLQWGFQVQPLLEGLSKSWHDDVIKWKHFPRYWLFVRGIHRSPVNSPHKGQWRGALMFSLICAWINGWVNNCDAGDLRRRRAHYDVIVMVFLF